MFDSGAMHSFISCTYACLSKKTLEPLECMMYCSTPLGEYVNCRFVLKNCVIQIQGQHLPIDLVIFYTEEFDVILGMDWLARYHACMECFKKEVAFKPPGEAEFHFSAV